MKILTFSDSQCQEILKLLAAILHLGNVCFEGECLQSENTYSTVYIYLFEVSFFVLIFVTANYNR